MFSPFECQLFFSYYEYLWLRNKEVDASSLFEGLPLSLQADISLGLYKDLIERVKSSLSFRLFAIYFFQFVLQLFFFFWGGGGYIICNKTLSMRIVDIVEHQLSVYYNAKSVLLSNVKTFVCYI